MEEFDMFQMVEAMKNVATLNRTVYMSHIEAGFSPKEAMQITVEAMGAMITTVMGLQGSQATFPPQ